MISVRMTRDCSPPKALFLAYAANAADHLAPYSVLCAELGMDCCFVVGELDPRGTVLEPPVRGELEKMQVQVRHILPLVERAGWGYWVAAKLYLMIGHCTKYASVRPAIERMVRYLKWYVSRWTDLGVVAAGVIRREMGTPRLVFVDEWNPDRTIVNGLLTDLADEATIVVVGHTVRHFRATPIGQKEVDFVFATNEWHSEGTPGKHKVVVGSLRFSKSWIARLDENLIRKAGKKSCRNKSTDVLKIVVLGSPKKVTTDWQRMLDLMRELTFHPSFEIRFKPHVRGMARQNAPEVIKDCWDAESSLTESVRDADVVLFWSSSAVFEAVVRKKVVLFLAFLSKRNHDYVWQDELPAFQVICDEESLFLRLRRIKEGQIETSVSEPSALEKVIWPAGDPWTKAAGILCRLELKGN